MNLNPPKLIWRFKLNHNFIPRPQISILHEAISGHQIEQPQCSSLWVIANPG